jgi:hypothetical protein
MNVYVITSIYVKKTYVFWMGYKFLDNQFSNSATFSTPKPKS